jgi:uncharacterized protein YajQ (UPF0234 family)
MSVFSFDIVSDYDKAEINNVFDQTRREIMNRYDFKNTPAAIDWNGSDKTTLLITGAGEWQIEAIIDIVRKKLATRSQSQKLLDTSQGIEESNLKAIKKVPLKHGLNHEQAKQITKQINSQFPRIKTSIQGDSIRVTSPSKNDLQSVIGLLKTVDFDFPLQFTNYR